jgi:nicotinate-nucleotide adenylyltransferase
MPILHFGGSFNPIHKGHLEVAQAVARARQFDHVNLIVSADPPHKSRPTGSGQELAASTDRLAMCRLATEADPLFSVDDIELHRTGPSYTLDTVRQLRRRDEISADEAVYWLIGGDSVSQLPRWHEAETLVREVEFVIAARPGFIFDWNALPPAFRQLRDHVVEAPLIDISATEIRRRVRMGKSLRGLVAPGVEVYIHAHQLYRG